MNVVVLEASERVGGRMVTDRREGFVIDRGAQFLSDGYPVIGELIRELGLARQISHTSGWAGTVRGGKVRRINSRYPWTLATSGLVGWRDLIRIARASRALTRATRQLPLSDYSRWHGMDDADAAQWAAAAFGRGALAYLFEPMLDGFYFQSPEGMSRAWPAIVWSFGARRKAVVALEGGIGRLPEALARAQTIHLRTPAEAVETSGSVARVKTSGWTLEADAVVLATTAPAAKRIYSPANDTEKRMLETEYSATVCVAVALAEGVSGAGVARDIYGVLIPRRERGVIASIGVESQKCRGYVPRGELLNVMLCGEAGLRLLRAPEEQLLAEVMPELRRYFPGIDGKIKFVQIARWEEAEPRSPVGRCRDIHEYRRTWHRGMKVVLAGDYMGTPCTEGAAESGTWAANALAGAGA